MLTAKYLDARLNKPQPGETEKAHRYGLSARIRKTGKISFVFRFRWLGKAERITIGSYPQVTISDASDIAKKYQAMIADNKNPKREVIANKIEESNELTVKQLIEKWHQDYFREHPEYGVDHGYPYKIKRSMELHIYPVNGNLPWDLVTRRAWAKIFSDLKKKKPAITQLLVSNVKHAASYGLGHGLIKEHPLLDFTSKKTLGISVKRGKRILSHDEIFKVFEAIDESGFKPGNKILFKLLMIYGCRTIELRLCQPAHLDIKNGVWTVPPEIAKPSNKKEVELNRPIIRPLFDETIELFEQAMALHPKSKYVFPKEDGTPMGTSAMLDIPPALTKRILNKYPNTEMESWSKHDFRRTMRTNMSKLAPPHVAETMIGHVLPGEGKTYDHYDYLEEQLIGYQKWYQVLDNIWNQRDNVTVIGKRKGA